MTNLIKRLVKEEEGQGMVEYALIIVGIALVAMAGVKLLGPALSTLFSGIAGDVVAP